MKKLVKAWRVSLKGKLGSCVKVMPEATFSFVELPLFREFYLALLPISSWPNTKNAPFYDFVIFNKQLKILFSAGIVVVFKRAVGWRLVGRLGSEVLPSCDSVFHMCTDTIDPHQHVVVFCHDINKRRVCRDILGSFRLRG